MFNRNSIIILAVAVAAGLGLVARFQPGPV